MALTQNSYPEGSVGSTLAAKNPSELERGFNAATHLHELLNELDNKLSPVLNRTPQDSVQSQNELSPHISTLVEVINQAANKVQTLISGLAV